MSATARVMVDPEAVPISVAIRTAAQAAPMLVIQQGALADLAAELGSMDAAAAFLLELAENLNTPIGVNIETGTDTSSTTFLAPPDWTPERLQGWVATRHAELVEQFGEVARVGAAGPSQGELS